MTLAAADLKLLDVVQSDFPIVPHPFRTLAETAGGSEDEVLARVRELQAKGYIREVGAVFDLKRLGYVSTLCAAQVAADSVDAVAALINSFAEVTHNYLREDPFNVWFTVIARSAEHIEKILDRVRAKPGVARVISLPQRKMFKISVHFATSGEKRAPAAAKPRHVASASPVEFQEWEARLIRELSEPLPLVETPFEEVAQRAEIVEDLAIERINAWVADGTIRRFGARVAHREVGYPANGMSVWKVASEQAEAVGRYMAEQPEVSHCYLRDVQPGWDYNLYGMIHGATTEDVEAVANRIAEQTSLYNYKVLFSTKELKKTAPRYFAESS